MRRVASIVMALAMAATLSMGADAAPAKVENDGREHLHNQSQHSASLLDLFDSELFRRLPRLGFDFRWPPFGLGQKAKIENGGREQRHMEQHNFLYFFGSDTWRHWAFAHAGVQWSPAGLENAGFALKVVTNGGAYRYRSGSLNNTTVIGREYSFAAMPGWRFKRENSVVTVFAGLDVQQFRTIPVDPDARLLGRHLGTRGTVELWHEPNPTTMLAADLSLSSLRAGNYARIAYGWRVLDRCYLGPEVQAYVTDQYRHARAGIQVTAFKTEDRELSGAIGYANDNDHRSGIYVRVNVLTRR